MECFNDKKCDMVFGINKTRETSKLSSLDQSALFAMRPNDQSAMNKCINVFRTWACIFCIKHRSILLLMREANLSIAMLPHLLVSKLTHSKVINQSS